MNAAQQKSGRTPSGRGARSPGAFAMFARYLAARPDLLPSAVRGRLACIVSDCPPMSWGALRDAIHGVIGCEIEDAFMAFEVTPITTSPYSEVHRARLRDGTPVNVTIVNAVAADRLQRECARVTLAREELNHPIGPAALRCAMEDFTAAFARKRDLSTLATAHRAWERAHVDGVAVPRVYDRLSGATMLTTEAIGVRLSRVHSDVVPGDIACRLCTAWVQSATAGLPFATDLDADRIGLTESGSIVWNAPEVSGLTPQERADLWEYLVALAVGDVDAACSRLLAHTLGKGAEDQLRHEFRQIVPFRDGPWGDAKPTLAEQLFMQWERASAAGRFPSGGFCSVYRGLYTVSTAARVIDPGGDHLRNAIAAVRILNALQSVRSLVTGENVEDVFDRYARASLEVPRKLDDVLTLASGRASFESGGGTGADPSAARNRFTALLASAMLFVSITLILPRIGADWVRVAWGREFLSISYGLAGLLLVLMLGRRPRSLERRRG